MKLYILIFAFLLCVSIVNAVEVVIDERFMEGGASMIAQPIWLNYTQEQEPIILGPDPTVIAGAVGEGLKIWAIKNYVWIIGIVGVFCFFAVYKRYKRKSGVLEKQIFGGEKNEFEGEDKMGNIREIRRTTVPGRKGVFRRNVE